MSRKGGNKPTPGWQITNNKGNIKLMQSQNIAAKSKHTVHIWYCAHTHSVAVAAAAVAKYLLKSNCEQVLTGSLHQSHGKSDTET